MNEKDIFNAIGNVGDELIEKTSHPPKKRALKYKAVIAACICLFAALSAFSIYALAAEAEEYRNAVAFFEENDLDLTSLSREDIKAVYRDITQKTFSYEKTAEVLNSLSLEIYNIEIGSSDSETLKDFWSNRVTDPSGELASEIKYSYKNDVHLSEPIVERYNQDVIYCKKGDVTLWEFRADPNITVYGIIPAENGVLAYGRYAEYPVFEGYAHIFMLDTNGALVWEYLDTEFDTAYRAGLIDGGNIVLFGGQNTSDTEYSVFTKLTLDGKAIVRELSEADDMGTWYSHAVRVEDVYLVKRYNSIVSFTLDGKPTEFNQYFDGDTQYRIKDMICVDDKVFISAYTVESDQESAQQIFYIELDYNRHWTGEDTPFEGAIKDEYTELIQSVFSASLLICDKNGVISTAYRASGSVPKNELSINGQGEIVWDIQRIDGATPDAPTYSSHGVNLSVVDIRLKFSEKGSLIDKAEASECYDTRILY